MLTKQAIAISV